MSSLKKWQRIAIATIAVIFVFNIIVENWEQISVFVVKSFVSETKKSTNDQFAEICKQAERIHDKAIERIRAMPNPKFLKDSDSDFVALRDTVALAMAKIFNLRDLVRRERESEINSFALQVREKMISKLFPNGYSNEMGWKRPQYTNIVMGLVHYVSREQVKLLPAKPIPWDRVRNFLFIKYLEALLFVLLGILVIRWPKHRYTFSGVADVISVVAFSLAWPLFVWGYRPDNALKRRLGYYLNRYRKEHGNVKGVKVIYAYTFAIFFAVASFVGCRNKFDSHQTDSDKNQQI